MRTFGVVGDGETDCNLALMSAIETQTGMGGGEAVFNLYGINAAPRTLSRRS